MAGCFVLAVGAVGGPVPGPRRRAAAGRSLARRRPPPEHADAIMLLNRRRRNPGLRRRGAVEGGLGAADPGYDRGPRPAARANQPSRPSTRSISASCGPAAFRRSAVLLLDGQARSTYDEAVAAADYLGRSAPQRLLVVTNGFHTRRARWIFQRVLAGRAARISLVAARRGRPAGGSVVAE